MSAPDVDAILERRRLVVCVGPGGVGKTSVSAALALAAARDGRRVFVLTIDPARRLADALSIRLGDVESEIPLPAGTRGSVHAAMLETRASWDAFVARVAEDPEVRARISENRVYRAFSRTLARSHAYVAMERLHHALHEHGPDGRPRWDLVVLDTPPTRSALDVLDAPASLSRFVDERVVGAFVGAGSALLARSGAAAITRALSLLMGGRLAGELVAFLAAFAPLREGFARRADDVRETLVAPTTAFVLVAAPLATHLDDAAFLASDLARRGVELDAIAMNRAFHVDPWDPTHPLPRDSAWDAPDAIDALSRAPGATRDEAERAVAAALSARRRALADDLRAEAAIDAFVAEHGRGARALALPLLAREPCSPAALLGLIDAARGV